MTADMMARTFYLPPDTASNLTAAKTTASQLCRQASLEALRTLREHGWIDDETLPHPDSTTDDQLAALAERRRTLAERELHTPLDRRDVHRHRLDRDDRVGVDEYTTGLNHGDGPTDAFDDWDLVSDDDQVPHWWPAQLGAAAGRLHPWGDGPAVATVTLHAWH